MAGKEQIFVSPGAIFDGKKAIRGGVPLVFPQFGQPDQAMPQHGVARTAMWSVKEILDSTEGARAVLTLSDSEATRALWDHPFLLEYEVVLTTVSLQMTLRIQNSGETSFKFNSLLHTYFRVDDIGETAVRGLLGRSYVDKVDGGTTKIEKEAHIVLPHFVDRVYIAPSSGAKDVTIGSKTGGAYVAVVNEARIGGEAKPCDIVVWNPYEGASPGDLPVPAFKSFVCVEPGLVSEFHELAAGGRAELSQKIVPL